jgi:serine phosphatase RsbU (regulator of sigma subunit)
MRTLCLVIVFTLLQFALQGQNLNKLDSLKLKLSVEKSDTGKVILQYRIAYELQFSDPERSLKYTNEALSLAERINYKRGIGNSLIQLGNIEQIKGNFSGAEEYTLKALEILEKADDQTGIAICYNNLGILAHNSNDYSKAIEYYTRSLQINSKIGRRSGEATSLYCIGTVYENKAEYDSALKFYFKAESISESIGDSRLMAYGKTSLANVYFITGDYAKSLSYNEDAILLYQKSGNDFGLLKVYTSLGLIAEKLDTNELALWCYRNALKISLRLESVNDEANIYFSFAGLFEKKGSSDSAKLFYENALKLFKETWNRENEALSLIALGRLKNSENNFSRALVNLQEALKIAGEINSPNALTEAYRELAKTYTGLKDYSKAFSSLNHYSAIRDSLMSVEKQKQILELQTQYETTKKDKENEILRKDQQLLKNTRNSLIIGALLLLTIAVVILRSLGIKKRDNILLKHQKVEIQKQKEIVEAQKTSITDSIRYARRIQSAMLTPEELFKNQLADSFLLYLPRDIVSGDFYWLRELNQNRIVICVADCTGHGVPGAFMSMLGMSLLNDIVNLNHDQLLAGTYSAADILNELRERVKTSLRQSGREGETRDGMDMSLCIIEKDNNKICYSGANNSVYIVNNLILTELKATRNPVGIYLNELSFTNQIFEYQTGSVLYMFSDGYSDQIGSGGKKFLSKNFKILLSEISRFPMEEIKEKLHKTHLEWRADEEQVDDILVTGIRLA